MSKTIWKFEIGREPEVEMPEGGVILSAEAQGDSVFMWALVDPEAPKSRRKINVYGTGRTVSDAPGTFVGTVMMRGGRLVFHVFDAGTV